MVSNSYGARINRLRGAAFVESYRWRRRSDLAHCMVRCCTRHSWHLFWLPTAQPAHVGSLKGSYQATAAGLDSFRGLFWGIRHALFAPRAPFLRDKAGSLRVCQRKYGLVRLMGRLFYNAAI